MQRRPAAARSPTSLRRSTGFAPSSITCDLDGGREGDRRDAGRSGTSPPHRRPLDDAGGDAAEPERPVHDRDGQQLRDDRRRLLQDVQLRHALVRRLPRPRPRPGPHVLHRPALLVPGAELRLQGDRGRRSPEPRRRGGAGLEPAAGRLRDLDVRTDDERGHGRGDDALRPRTDGRRPSGRAGPGRDRPAGGSALPDDRPRRRPLPRPVPRRRRAPERHRSGQDGDRDDPRAVGGRRRPPEPSSSRCRRRAPPACRRRSRRTRTASPPSR